MPNKTQNDMHLEQFRMYALTTNDNGTVSIMLSTSGHYSP